MSNDARDHFAKRLARALNLAERENACPHCLSLALLAALLNLSRRPGYNPDELLRHIEQAGIAKVLAVGILADAPPGGYRH